MGHSRKWKLHVGGADWEINEEVGVVEKLEGMGEEGVRTLNDLTWGNHSNYEFFPYDHCPRLPHIYDRFLIHSCPRR